MLKKIINGIIITALASIALAVVVRLFFTYNIIEFSIGIIIGSALSVIRMTLINNMVNKSVNMVKNVAVSYTTFNYIGRYLLSAAILVGCFFLSEAPAHFMFWGCALGMTVIAKVAIFTANRLGKVKVVKE